MAKSKATQQTLERQIAIVKKQGGKDLTKEREVLGDQLQWQFRGVTIGVKEIVTYDRGGSWPTGRVAVYVKADIGRPSRYGGRATVSRQYCTEDFARNASKALATAKEFASTLAEATRIEVKRDKGFDKQVERVKQLLGSDIPPWVRFEPNSEGKIRFALGTFTVTPEQACAFIRIVEPEEDA